MQYSEKDPNCLVESLEPFQEEKVLVENLGAFPNYALEGPSFLQSILILVKHRLHVCPRAESSAAVREEDKDPATKAKEKLQQRIDMYKVRRATSHNTHL